MLDKITQKINDLIQFESQQGTRIEQRLVLVNFLKGFLARKSLEEVQNKSIIETISDSIINWYNQDADPYNRLLYVQVMIRLREVKDNSSVSNLDDRIRNFISDIINVDIIDKLSKKELNYFVSSYHQEFRTAIGRIPEIFDKVHNLLPQEVVDKVIIDFINSRPQIVSDKLKLIQYKVENPVQVVGAMLDKVQQLESSIQEQYFKSIAKMQCGKDPSLIERFYTILVGLKPQKPEIVKRYSCRRFFNEAQKKALQENL